MDSRFEVKYTKMRFYSKIFGGLKISAYICTIQSNQL